MSLEQETIGSFKVRQHLHTGTNGEVYSAIDPMTGQKVAIKVMHRHLTNDDARAAAFEDSVRRVGFLGNPGIVRVLSTARLDDGSLGIISEFVLGQTLADLIHDTDAPLEVEQSLDLLDALALVLAAVHGNGFVHGNLKPENVFLTPRSDGRWPPQLRVADFGVAHLLQPATASEEAAKDSPLAACPYYLSPEQCRGEEASPRSDIYTLGVIAYQLITGRLPYSSPRPADVLSLHCAGEPRPPSEIVPLDPALEASILKAMAPKPTERYETVIEFRNALASLRQERTEQRTPNGGVSASQPTEPDLPPAPPRPEPALEDKPTPTADKEPEPADEEEPEKKHPPADAAGSPKKRQPRRKALSAAATAEVVMARRSLLPWVLLWLAVVSGAVIGVYRMAGGNWPWQRAAGEVTRGVLEINTIPAGATVYLNSRKWDRKTPVRIAVERRLTYQFLLHKRGFLGVSRKVALGVDEDRRFIEIKLVPVVRWGTLQISTSQKADIFLDSRRVGSETTEVNLAEVRADVEHLLRIVAPGFKTIEQKVRISQGKVSALKFDLRRVDSSAREQ